MADPHEPPGASPVLVTGLPRSGTSWVGKMLEAGGEVTYVNEPLNPRHPPGRSPGVLDVDVDHRFPYICDDNERAWRPAFEETVRLRYHPVRELRRNHRPYDLARLVKYLSAFSAGRLRGRRALLDDPYAVLSAAWFARRLGCRVVVLVRDPAAVIGSWQRLGWSVDVGELLDQPLLVRDLPGSFVAEIRESVGSDDTVAAAALLWRLTYAHVHGLGDLPGLHVCRYEDLAADPVTEFQRLFCALGLAWSARTERRVGAATTVDATTVDATMKDPRQRSSGRPHSWSLRGGVSRTAYQPMSSTEALESYRTRLSPDVINRIRALTSDIAPLFYRNHRG